MNIEIYSAMQDRPQTLIEGAVCFSRNLNNDLSSLVQRLDAVCTRLHQGNYSKNQPQKSIDAKPDQNPSQGVMDDLNGLNYHKESLIQELRVAVEYLEQHI